MEYLQKRHELIKGERLIGQKSAKQYQHRLNNLQANKIYNGEKHVNEQIQMKINTHYKDKRNMYPRTIKYYIEYMNYFNHIKIN